MPVRPGVIYFKTWLIDEMWMRGRADERSANFPRRAWGCLIEEDVGRVAQFRLEEEKPETSARELVTWARGQPER